jgi:signal peptidase II
VTVLADQRRRWATPLLVGTAILGLDQLTKWWASGALEDRNIDLFWTLRLHLVFNTGAAFSRGEGLGPLLSLLVLVVLFDRSLTPKLR